MPRGHWSFLHEWVIYEYLMHRFDEGTLRLRQVIESGSRQRRDKWHFVTHLEPITGTSFPDIKGIGIKGKKTNFPAEVKFVTSTFNYHKDKRKERFEGFLANGGCVLVLRHDYLPNGLEGKAIDVFEIDRSDFTSYCRENFGRLLGKQLQTQDSSKFWVMYQGPNFNKSTESILPGRKSGIWCPTENLTGFDIAAGDRVLFVKTKGAATQAVQPAYLEGKVNSKWKLQEIFIAEVASAIYSRREYCDLNRIDFDTKLWVNDKKNNGAWRWNRVFEFNKIRVVELDVGLQTVSKWPGTWPFVEALTQAYCWRTSRELSDIEYQSLLESLIGRQMFSDSLDGPRPSQARLL